MWRACWPVAVFAAIFLSWAIVFVTLIPDPAVRYEQFGYEAAASGVPANANPYLGRDSYDAGAWLRGWMRYQGERGAQ
jgi:hypothetical protein